jgi:hypothetical protein
MTHLGLIASSALIAAASAVQAAPYTFQASLPDSSLALTCGPTAQTCTRLRAELDFDAASGTAKVNPSFNFGFIEFDGVKPVKPTKTNQPKNSKKNDNKPQKTPDQEEKFSGDFGITATLAFSIMNVPGLYNVIAKGRGNFAVEDDDITFLTLLWDDVKDVTIPGVGTFAFSFDNLGNKTPFLRQSSNVDRDEDNGGSSEENDDNLILDVNATVENVSVVPLPGGAVLLLSALGLIGIGAARRRRTTA